MLYTVRDTCAPYDFLIGLGAVQGVQRALLTPLRTNTDSASVHILSYYNIRIRTVWRFECVDVFSHPCTYNNNIILYIHYNIMCAHGVTIVTINTDNTITLYITLVIKQHNAIWVKG